MVDYPSRHENFLGTTGMEEKGNLIHLTKTHSHDYCLEQHRLGDWNYKKGDLGRQNSDTDRKIHQLPCKDPFFVGWNIALLQDNGRRLVVEKHWLFSNLKISEWDICGYGQLYGCGQLLKHVHLSPKDVFFSYYTISFFSNFIHQPIGSFVHRKPIFDCMGKAVTCCFLAKATSLATLSVMKYFVLGKFQICSDWCKQPAAANLLVQRPLD